MRRGLHRLFVLSLALYALTLVGCDDAPPAPEDELGARADSAVVHLQNGQWERLAQLVHPDRGVTFSPYGYVELEEAVVFSRAELRSVDGDTTRYRWGFYDGTGDPIELTPSEYMAEFVRDRDFSQARRGLPGEVLGTGNTLNNVPDAFYYEPPGSQTAQEITFIEYHDPGSEDFGGMDWASLRLVFEREADQWYLIGVVRDHWTI